MVLCAYLQLCYAYLDLAWGFEGMAVQKVPVRRLVNRRDIRSEKSIDEIGSRPIDEELIDPMDEFVGYKIRRVNHAIIGELNEILREFDLRIMDFAILCIVDANPDLYQNSIARLLGAEPPAVVLALDRLEAAGHLARQLDPKDRRVRSLRLTASGKQMHKRALNKVEMQERRIKHAMRATSNEVVTALDNLMRNYGLK